MKRRLVTGLAFAWIAAVGCKNNDIASTTNVACAQDNQALAQLCPAGTALDAHAAVDDPVSCKTDTPPGDGAVSSVCRIDNGCAITCKVVLACDCGAALIAHDQLQCSKCETCGNGKVEAGEACDQGAANGTGTGCDKNCQISVGTPCGTNGDLRCAPDSRSVEVCTDSIWHKATDCTTDEACNAQTKTCALLPTYCPTPTALRCVGEFTRESCSDDHRWAAAPCPADRPSCVTVAGNVSCSAGDGTVSVSTQYRLGISVGEVSGQASSPNYSLRLGDGRSH